jgi:Polyketide cyclase / dehydrase and lipid transport
MKKSEHKISLEISADVDNAWRIIGAVDGVDKWLGPIVSCRVSGAKRYCATQFEEFEEDILKVDHEARVFKYGIPTQGMIPVKNIIGTMRTESRGEGKSLVEWEWEYDVDPNNEDLAKDMLTETGSMGIRGIEELVKKGRNIL